GRPPARSAAGDDGASRPGTGTSGGDGGGGAPSSRERRKRRRKKRRRASVREEAPEASVARLTSSYAAAMSAVGALHRLSRRCVAQSKDEGVGREATARAGTTEDGEAGLAEVGDGMAQVEPEGKAAERKRRACAAVEKAASAARSALERSLLLDDAILAPAFLPPKGDKGEAVDSPEAGEEGPSSAWLDAWHGHGADAAVRRNERRRARRRACLAKWSRLSAAQRATVRKISYLALANYADLLLCGRAEIKKGVGSGRLELLDRGAVRRLDALNLLSSERPSPPEDKSNDNSDKNNNCDDEEGGAAGTPDAGADRREIARSSRRGLWADESPARTARLALAAYCDASELDPSDPALWFKLACAARALGREEEAEASEERARAEEAEGTADGAKGRSEGEVAGRKARRGTTSYRRLERLALARGLASLPPGVPPNRLLTRAWDEMNRHDQGAEAMCHEPIEDDDGPVGLVLRLPRYSWTALGRALLRATREGTTGGAFASPLVEIVVNPLLKIPSVVLGRICGSLEETDVYRLACTCRPMLSELAAARAKAKSLEDATPAPTANEAGKDENLDDSAGGGVSGPTCAADPGGRDAGANAPSRASGAPRKADATSTPRRGRVSKRVRSHQITSEKQAERKAKRSSVEYCLLAGTLSCTTRHPRYVKALEADCGWDDLPLMKQCLGSLPAHLRAIAVGLGSDLTGMQPAETKARSALPTEGSNSFLAPSSLNAFVEKWSKRNSGPRHVLELFLTHVSLHTEDVFDLETADALSSCVTDCFDSLVASDFPWYGQESFDGDLDRCLQVLAVNLLNAELRLKRCESHDVGSQEHQDDSSAIECMMPMLLRFSSAMSAENGSSVHMTKLLEMQCRCYWLASTHHLWIGRCSNDASISKATEDIGVEYMNEAMVLISGSSQREGGGPGRPHAINTPHLESSDRRGDHWSSLSATALLKYREHLQSSSIVSRARQCYQEIQSKEHESTGSDSGDTRVVSADDKARFLELGSQLLERYNVSGGDALQELLNDFLLLHEDQLLSALEKTHSTESGRVIEMSWGRIGTVIPSDKSSTLTSCPLPNLNHRPSTIQVLASSLVAAGDKMPPVFLIYSQMVTTALLLQAQTSDRVTNGDDGSESTTGNVKRERLLTLVVTFFLDKMTDMIISYPTEIEMCDALESFVDKKDWCCVIYSTLNASHFPDESDDNGVLQIHLLQSISRFVLSLQKCPGLSRQAREEVGNIYFVTLVKSLIFQTKVFAELIDPSSKQDKRAKKWQLIIASKADLIAFTSSEIAEMLSLNPSSFNADGTSSASHLVEAITSKGSATTVLAQMLEALLFLWKSTSSIESGAVRDRLMAPISGAIISLCACTGVSFEGALAKESDQSDGKSDKEDLSFSDYFDSDNSVNGLFLPEGSTKRVKQQNRRDLLRKICQLVQCISLVLQSVDDKIMAHELAYPHFPSSQHGPFLPLVAVRVLSSLSDGIFVLFSENVWDEYPFGARKCGGKIDSLLGNAYMYLYGFSFNSADPETSRGHAPESIKAATQLFRCIKRVYSDNRRSTPRKAFETVELALPPATESRPSKAIRNFLFDAKESIDEENEDDGAPPGFPEWVLDEAETASLSDDENQDSIEVLRRRVCHELAKDPIMHLDSSIDDQGLSEERELTKSHEESLAKKFRAVLDDLCYNPNNIEGWIVLSECLIFKAEVICERLVPIQQSAYGSSEFYLKPESKRQAPATMSLDELKQSQFEEFKQSRRDWTPFIGNDLYPYMHHPWSNLSSLQNCEREIGSSISQSKSGMEGDVERGGDKTNTHFWLREIKSKYENDYAAWAASWAGMFVQALRTMRVRALLVARYLAKKSQGGMHPSEVSEDLGTALYGDLMASTMYGYPMKKMTLHQKRTLAKASNFYFQEAVELSCSSEYNHKSQTIPWECQFMIGKCYEKMAATLGEEKFTIDSSADCQPTRVYETYMTDAIKNYSEAFRDSNRSNLSMDKVGGSSHGAFECLYRLHAARFKVLLSAVRRVKGECELAEVEAFRIASLSWFDESNNRSPACDTRGRTWDVYADCVDAFTHCRREIPLFHRAAYRLAQAYNWAPAFHDPDCDLILGSKQAVPAIKCYRIRGLDTGSCAESANGELSS
ncbi:hypothetical protein ACHAWF_016144, partial [Thalassiosira exigua]